MGSNSKKSELKGVDFHEIFDAYVATNEKVWQHDRRKSVGASETFGCIRKAFFSKKEYPKDSDHAHTWGATHRGDIIENYHVAPALRMFFGENIIWCGEDQITLVSGTTSATPDGLAINQKSDALSRYGIKDIKSNCFVIEIKSMDPRTSLNNGPKDVHFGQVQMQMGLIRETTDYKPNFAVIIYTNAATLDDKEIFVVEFDKDIYEEGKRRNQQVFDTEDPKYLTAEGNIDGSCRYCPWTQECAKANVARVPEKDTKKKVPLRDENLEKELAPMLNMYYSALQAEKKAKEDKEDATEAIKETMMLHQRRYFNDGENKISWYTSKGRKRLDKSKVTEIFQKNGLDIEDAMSTGEDFDTLKISKEGK